MTYDVTNLPDLAERYFAQPKSPETVTFRFENEDELLAGMPALLNELSHLFRSRLVRVEAGVRPNVRKRYNRNTQLMSRVAELTDQTGEVAFQSILRRKGWHTKRDQHSISLLYRDQEHMRCELEKELGREAAYKLASHEQGLIAPTTVKDIVLRERKPQLHFTLRITVC